MNPDRPIYMDHHATTPVDPRVLQAMLPFFSEEFGNAASTTHGLGRMASEAVNGARETIAAILGARPREIVFTSGATESNNLAIRGVVDRRQNAGRHIISVTTEHPAVLHPLKRLADRGYDVSLLPVAPAGDAEAGLVRVEQVADALCDDTVLVTVMLANNEIGAIQPVEPIARLCKQRGILIHTDATQAVGRMPVDLRQLEVDLMSFSAHKMYGPKGIGGLYVRRRNPVVKLEPLLLGGGHEGGLRSGTLNVPGIVGMATALEICAGEMQGEMARLAGLRGRLFDRLAAALDEIRLNGPALDRPAIRLPGNLNVSFGGVDGETLLLNVPRLAASSGSACTSAHPQPSHVLRALGLSHEAVRGSIRFGLGRGNTEAEVNAVSAAIIDSVRRLRRSSSRPAVQSGA